MEEYKKKYSKNKTYRSNKLTHFLYFPIENPNFIKSFEDLSEELITGNYIESEKLLQRSYKLHFTICVLDLDKQQVEKLKNLLDNLIPEINKIANSDDRMIVNFDGYGVMGSLNKSRTIYVKMKENSSFEKFKSIVNLIIKNLVDKELILIDDLDRFNIKYDKQTDTYNNLVHSTLLNSKFYNSYLRKYNQKSIYGFNSINLMKYLETRPLPDFEINSIYFTKMSSSSDGKYEKEKTYTLY